MNININEVKRLLDSQYQELECGDDNIKFNVLYNIIVTKKDFNIISYHNSLYIDIKKFIYRKFILHRVFNISSNY